MDQTSVDRILARLAAHNVRRQCNQHDCTAAAAVPTPCTHPHHQRDAYRLAYVLDMLGLKNEPVVTTPDELDQLLDAIRTTPPPGVDLGPLLLNALKDR